MTMMIHFMVTVVAVMVVVAIVTAATTSVEAFAVSPKVVQRRTMDRATPHIFLNSKPFGDDDDDGEETQLDFDHDDQFQGFQMMDHELMEEIKSKTFPLKDAIEDEILTMTTMMTTQHAEANQQQHQQTYRMGGDAHYTTGMVNPSSLSQEDADDCDEPYVDLMTGDELCWGVDPKGMDKNVVAVAVGSEEFVTSSKETEAPTTTPTINKTIKVDELYRSGGHAEFNHPFHLQHHDIQDHLTYEPTSSDKQHHHLLYHKHPTLLTAQEVEDCTGEPYIDFATGDELCWPS